MTALRAFGRVLFPTVHIWRTWYLPPWPEVRVVPRDGYWAAYIHVRVTGRTKAAALRKLEAAVRELAEETEE